MKKTFKIIIMLLLTAVPLWPMESKDLEEIIETITDSGASLKEKKIPPQSSLSPEINAGKEKTEKETAGIADEKDKSTSPASPEEGLLKSGIQLFEASLFKNAMQKFEELKSKYPESPYKDQSSIWLSKIHIELNNFSDAINVLNSIGRESGEYPSALFYIAEISLRRGDESAAMEYFYRVASLFPDHELADDSLISIAKLYLKNNKGNQALEAAIKVTKNYEKRETLDDAYFIIAQIFEKDSMLKDFGAARAIYKIFIKKANVDKAPYFSNSPLLNRVRANLRNIENTYYSKAFTG